MIIDTFLVADEWDMLELRLRTLALVVDKSIAVRCDRTHQGEPVEWPAPDAERFAPWADRLVWYTVTPSLELRRKNGDVWTRPEGERGPARSPWYQQIERAHRNGVADALRAADIPPSALVLISDVDEIPDPRVVAAWHDVTATAHQQRGYDTGGGYIGYVLEQRFHSTALDLLHPHQPWLGTCAVRASLLIDETLTLADHDAHSPQALRNARPDPEMIKIPHAGWHLSWFGTDAERQRKLDTFSHAELRDRYDPAEGRRRRMHANGEQLHHLSDADVERLDWPAPLIDGTFTVPDHWRTP